MKEPPATLVLRVPASLHRKLKREARDAETSLNKHCRMLLSGKGKACTEKPSASFMPAAGASHAAVRLQDLSMRILETWGNSLEGLVLFGSFSRGRETANSDIDLLVVLGRDVTLDRDVYARWRPHTFEGREVAPLFVQIPERGDGIGGLWFEVALDGIVLFDKDLRLSRFLNHVRDLIAGGRVRRMVTHGHPYWVHSAQKGGDA